MKIKYKLMLAMLAMALILFTLNGFTVLENVYREIKQEKSTVYTELIEQALRSFENISDDVEYYYFDACKEEGIGNILTLEKSVEQKKTQLRLKLNNLINNNSSYLVDACIVDLDDNYYFSQRSTTEQKAAFIAVYEDGMRGQETKWYAFKDTVYLCRAVYTLAPYVKRGYLVGQINIEYLRSMLGVENISEGAFLVLADNSEPLFGSTESVSTTQLQQLFALTENSYGTWLELDTEMDRLLTNRIVTRRGDWAILFAVSHSVMMARYFSILHGIVIAYILLIALAVLLSLLFSRGITKNISDLMVSINRIHDESLDLKIVVRGHDEVAELAKKYNWLLDYIRGIHRSEYELLELKYRFIQSQISPHFISNILSSISSYSMMGKSDQMEELCIKTSRYLKNNLRVDERRFTTLRDEINSVSEYVEIYRMISASDLEFICECAPEDEELEILSMLLQPLVENAVLHAFSCSDARMYKVTVRAHTENGWLFMGVGDNGCGMKDETLKRIERIKADSLNGVDPTGFGIGAVIRRLQLQYGDNYVLEVATKPDEGTVIRIGFPV